MEDPYGMTKEEKEAVEELKRRTIKDIPKKLLEDESLFYRFSKARDFNVQNAETMLRKHIVWREEEDIDSILEYKLPEVIKFLGESFLCFDKEGSPVRHFNYAMDIKGLQKSMDKSEFVKYNTQLVEMDQEYCKQQTKKLGKPVTNGVYIHNFEHITLEKVTDKVGLECSLLFARMYQDHYPERAKAIYFINAPSFLVLGFNIIKTVLASPLLKKIRTFGKEGWKEALLEIIDADQLPAFLGGTKTDPDGNPMCNTWIRHPQPIPESYYLKNSVKRLSDSPDVTKLVVSRLSREEVSIEVLEGDSYLEWEFETAAKDIGFGVNFKEDANGSAKEIVPKQKLDTSGKPEMGVLKCEHPGTYVLVFDNSHSWILQKEVYYRAKLRH